MREHRDLHDREQHHEERQAPQLHQPPPVVGVVSTGGGAVVVVVVVVVDTTAPCPGTQRNTVTYVNALEVASRDRRARSCPNPPGCCWTSTILPTREPFREAAVLETGRHDTVADGNLRVRVERRGASDPNPRRPRAIPLANAGCDAAHAHRSNCGSASSSTFATALPGIERRVRRDQPGPSPACRVMIPDSRPCSSSPSTRSCRANGSRRAR